jgi:hypothetical protein
MNINALYLYPFPQNDTTSSKLRISVKTNGSQPIFSAFMLIQIVTASLPPISTTSNYMTIYHAGVDSGSGLGIFLKYMSGNYYIGVRYIVKNGTTWNEIPNSFVNLSNYSTNINNDSFLVMLSYNVISTTTTTINFSLVNFSSEPKTSPDFTLKYTFNNTTITNGSQWGFGSSPQTNTSQYGLITSNGYNSYSSSGIYLTYLQAWTSFLDDSSTLPNTYAMFNNLYTSYSIYSIMTSKNYIPSGSSNLVFQLVVPSSTISQLNNSALSSTTPTYVTLTSSSSGYSPMPNFAVNGSSSGTTYISSVQNAIICILVGMKVLTENGYKLIEELQIKDKLLTNDNRIIDILNIHNYYAYPNDETMPFIIEKGVLGAIEDLYISKWHKVLVGDKFIVTKDLNIKQSTCESRVPIHYYHIETNDYLNDNIIANGVIIETYTNNDYLYNLK